MTYQLVKQVRDNDILRQSFFDLTVETFGLSFEQWYEDGFWSDNYIPYCLVSDQKVIANVSVNLMKIIFAGEKRSYIQIGTVMTAKEFRHQGLSQRLIETVLKDYQDVAAIYLFANDMVLDFYPKFGFQVAHEFQTSVPVEPVTSDFHKLSMDKVENRQLLKRLYQSSNPFSKLSVTDNYELLMFYCGNFMKDCVYYSANRDLIVVAIQNETNLECLDVFGETEITLSEVLNEVASSTTDTAHLGFTPPKTASMSLKEINSDEQLFVYSNKENIFVNNQLMFPLLSHT